MATDRPGRARFEGRSLGSSGAETLVQALATREVPVLQRSIRYHRPRAPFCGTGRCTGCLVRVNGVPNVRACRYVPSDGDDIRTENSWPSPRFDLLSILDRAFPHGLDTSHGFRRPRALTPFYQRVVRRLAGYGRLPDAAAPPPPTGERLDADVLVIGGGVSGVAAARALRERGIEPTVIERDPRGPAIDGVRWLSDTELSFLPARLDPARPFRALAVRSGTVGISISARRVLVATGGYDGPLMFPGNDRPGVLTAEGALALSPPSRPPPFHRAVLVGGGLRVAGLLDRWGERVEAVLAPGAVHGRVAEQAARLSIPVYPRTLILEAIGRARVRAIRFAARGGGVPSTLPADAIVLVHRRLPNPQLFFQAGARMTWRSSGGAYYPELVGCSTTVPGLWTAGSSAGFAGPESARISGEAAARAIAGEPVDPSSLPERVADGVPGELEGYYQELLGRFPHRGKLVVCPCEDVLLEEVLEASRRGFRGVEVIKRYTSAGTGLCQGRYCLPDILLVLSRLEGRPPAEVGYITQRPPVTPAPLSALAGIPEEPA
jgi:sarcosine oxidase, subunit alpha